VLDELPETLDGTYERTLLGINRQTWGYARRLFQCIAISIRPLHVEELAELFAILPDLETTPGFNIGWRPEDPEEFILSTCSTLVAIVDVRGKKVVQFTHFSVREYLTSDRIANSASASNFHILPKSAHTLLARACLGVLLQLDDSTQADGDKIIQNFPLALYAGMNWVDHARFEDVSSDIQDEMDCLFDRNKAHWAAWHWLYNMEGGWIRYSFSHRTAQHHVVPLYYAALCGFRDLAERLLNAHPKDVNSLGGYHKTPLYAALDKGHLNIAMLLLERGADVEIRGPRGQTAIYISSSRGYAELVRLLIDRGVDLNVVCHDDDYDHCWDITDARRTPLLGALQNGRLEIARMLLKHGADVEYPDNVHRRPLHIASCHPSNDLARLLLDHGANPNASDICGKTTLHEASSRGYITVAMLLLEYGANVDSRSVFEWTPLHCAARQGHQEVVRLLLDHGADANAQKDDRWTALHEAACHGHLQVVEVLLKRGADPRARTCGGMTPFQLASKRNFTQVMRLLSERTGE
jgi:ankyrin repeat protein